VDQRPQNGSVEAAGVDDRAAVLDDTVPDQEAARPWSEENLVEQMGAVRLGEQQTAVETHGQRVSPRLGARPRPVQVHAVGNQRAARVQVNRQAIVARVGSVAGCLVNDLGDDQDSSGQIDHRVALF